MTVNHSDQPIQYPVADVWQVERIKAGIAAANDGHVRLARAVFRDIAAKYGWTI